MDADFFLLTDLNAKAEAAWACIWKGAVRYRGAVQWSGSHTRPGLHRRASRGPVELNRNEGGREMDGQNLTHFNTQGRARMVDVSDKPATKRKAVAASTVRMAPETLARIRQGGVEKGDVLAVAQVAGILAAKKTPELVPMCHPLPLTGIDIRFAFPDDRTLRIEAEVTTTAPTGVEMEALTAVSVAALTVYDMCKALDKAMVIGPTYLVEKRGGKSGDFVRDEVPDAQWG